MLAASQPLISLSLSLSMQGFSFLWRYVEFRGHSQESLYNLGRALHQLNLTHLAIHYYQKALSLPPVKLEVSTTAPTVSQWLCGWSGVGGVKTRCLCFRALRMIRWTCAEKSPSTFHLYTRLVGTWKWPASTYTHIV